MQKSCQKEIGMGKKKISWSVSLAQELRSCLEGVSTGKTYLLWLGNADKLPFLFVFADLGGWEVG